MNTIGHVTSSSATRRRLAPGRFLVVGALVGVGALVTASLAAGASPGASPVRGGGPVSSVHAVPSLGSVLYSQNDHDADDGIVSDHFDPDPSHYRSRGADDFVVPSGATWHITAVDVTGRNIGSYHATSENVVFYRSRSHLPGGAVAHFHARVGTEQGNGSFAIPLGRGVTLSEGTYWVSVQVNDRGFWVWETTDELHGHPAAWKNPPDGFAYDCPTFGVMFDCVGDLGQGPDFMFLLQGSSD